LQFVFRLSDIFLLSINPIGDVMVIELGSSAVDTGSRFEPRSVKFKEYPIGICCFSTKHAALRRKSNDWSARNPDNVSEWGDMSIRGRCFSKLALY
jgi:hypothetical protein